MKITGYIKKMRFYLALYVIQNIIFMLMFLLYHLPLESFVYGFVLTTFVFVIFAACQAVAYKNKIKKLEVLEKYPFSDEAEEADDLIESKYLKIIEVLRVKYKDLLEKQNSESTDRKDYYTTWVHQIKTPISAMKMILQKEDTESNRLALSELFRIEQYTEMVLSYTRLESETNDLVIKEISLDKVIREVIRKYAYQFIMQKVKLVYEGTTETALSDEKWLGLMMELVISNSLKYTPNGTVSISVESKCITISDTGIGIAKEDLPRIFEKGFTGYNGHENKKSTGLGLYLCKKISDKLCHHIYVESELGKGTRFTIDLNTKLSQVE